MNLDFSQASILIVGDVMLDSYWQGSTDRISPEAPVPVVHVRDKSWRVGGSGNVGWEDGTLAVSKGCSLMAPAGLSRISLSAQDSLLVANAYLPA